ncbi:hypothetical protein D3C78_1395550 [compost metagenome]
MLARQFGHPAAVETQLPGFAAVGTGEHYPAMANGDTLLAASETYRREGHAHRRDGLTPVCAAVVGQDDQPALAHGDDAPSAGDGSPQQDGLLRLAGDQGRPLQGLANFAGGYQRERSHRQSAQHRPQHAVAKCLRFPAHGRLWILVIRYSRGLEALRRCWLECKNCPYAQLRATVYFRYL